MSSRGAQTPRDLASAQSLSRNWKAFSVIGRASIVRQRKVAGARSLGALRQPRDDTRYIVDSTGAGSSVVTAIAVSSAAAGVTGSAVSAGFSGVGSTAAAAGCGI